MNNQESDIEYNKNGAPAPYDKNGDSKAADAAGDSSSEQPEEPQRAMWGSQLEFLMSCIATSVGLGNVWRFPFVAYQNGGGAFLLPYIIVLFVIGKPMYYLECILGQFSSRNSVEIWALSPAMRGTGYAQALTSFYVLSYYVSIIALCLYYFSMSFASTLPWAECDPSWINCVPSAPGHHGNITNESLSSAELYFLKTVLRQVDTIEGGIGLPLWDLTLCLLAAWVVIFAIVARGVKSSGKAAYFLAIFPYVVMITLLITTCTLPGSGNGMLFFITPRWEFLLDLNVWYAATTQLFFSLSVCTGALVMFSSYNGFRQNIYRDAMIVTTLDTFTSLISGLTIFGILGNLAYELEQEIQNVIGGAGTGLAFISYPDAIAKTFLPQLFAVLFFVMLAVLGVGSGVALLSTINTVLLDAFPHIKTVFMSLICCTIGFSVGLIYVTPGGQYVLALVDHYGGTFLPLFSAISEVIGVIWIYGLENICLDIEFMLGIKTSIFWRWCWGFITPVLMIVVFVYAMVSFEQATFGDYIWPTAATVSGYLMLALGVLFVPTFICVTLIQRRKATCVETVKSAFSKDETWGPRSPSEKKEWVKFKNTAEEERQKMAASRCRHIWLVATGGYRRHIQTKK